MTNQAKTSNYGWKEQTLATRQNQEILSKKGFQANKKNLGDKGMEKMLSNGKL